MPPTPPGCTGALVHQFIKGRIEVKCSRCGGQWLFWNVKPEDWPSKLAALSARPHPPAGVEVA